MLIALRGITTPIFLHHCDALLEPLADVLGSWRFRIIESSPTSHPQPAAAISVRQLYSNCYNVASPWLDEPVVERTEVGAIFSLTAELGRAFAEERPERLCLHCAAVETDGHLILFPNSENAGKSTLTVMLASRGKRLFADDVLGISHRFRHGIALGIAPRLRLPLPRRAGVPFKNFVKSHQGPRDSEFLYLAIPLGQSAKHGQTAPIGAIVVLDRRRSVSPRLAALAKGPALRQMIIQNFAPNGTTITTLNRLSKLIEKTPCYSLSYSNLEGAADLLCGQFQANSAPWRGQSSKRSEGPSEIVIGVSSGSAQHWPRFKQAPGVAMKTVDNDLFLVKGGAAIFHLNTVAATLWNLLEQPTAIETAINAVRQAFPFANARRVKRDVQVVFDALQDGGLIQISRR